MLKQTLQQKMLQKLSPQQIQLMKLLQLPTVALEQRIKEELEINPALDEGKDEDDTVQDDIDSNDYDDDSPVSEAEKEFDYYEYSNDDDTPDYKLYANNKGKDEETHQMPVTGGVTFHEVLEAQLRLTPLGENKMNVAKHLIGSLDDSGYLRRDLSAIIDDLAFTQNISTNLNELQEALAIIQQLDPPGVGARNLQECLLLQIKRKDNKKPSVILAREILQEKFEEFTKKHFDKISKYFNASASELKDAIAEILKLNPKPGNSIGEVSKSALQIVPDYLLTIEEDEIIIAMNSRNAPELKISRTYANMLEDYSRSKEKSKSQRDAVMFVKQKLDAAKWFIDAIQQRQNTLLYTMEAIASYQKEYFLEGDETKLKPMILKDIADIVGLDISTVSRVVNSKYVQTPYGTFLLKSFFSESLSTDSGEEVSTREVKKILQEEIGKESKKKPLTDDHLAKVLKQKGYNIARRTVAKYREQLDIPVARMRKEL
ncbi:MAG: RNA polymerase factor sigma-54 [Bacteroidetes bacterium]|nr:RNA polymerase sigma-54 factor [Bacteroidota bacterium]MBV6461070.1 RNA polymerase sigma-54 factor [Flavobacteriales bacterium]WKZ75533.1 MAG: RNA polymerase factor sigma-54 [Vicingaceae bacterium]MCL4815099.1 RNA polymerase factor sigma-54 [Flavobacteriales bacterium]NOG94794.1 RNA polymerase factor sigma-54 [Bacteroidota bacterium]